MKNLIQAAVVILFASSAAQAQQAVQWKVSDGGNGHWYGYGRVQISDATFLQTQDAAVRAGGHLPTVTSASENAFVFQNIGGGLGLFRQPGGSWQNVTGEPVSYQNWAPGDPNGSTTALVFAAYCCHPANTWADYSDADLGNPADPYTDFRIEWSADCNNDGIVDYGQCHDGTLPDYNGNNIPDCCERGEACVVGNYPVQWRVEVGGNGHWYGFGAIAVGDASWMQMRDGAVAMGGHLLTLSSAVEDDFAFDLWRASQPFQGQDMMAGPLGYFVMPGGSWQSVNGEPMTYTNWRPATTAPPLPPAPDNGNAVHRFATWLSADWGPLAGRWEDWLDSELGNPGDPISPFMVEWDADCNNDGTVDYGQILQGQLADLNTDGVPDVCQQPTCADADLFRNGMINGADLGILLSEWGPANANTVSDINKDGFVNGADLGIMLSFWGACSS
jgi:hypothetical protein